MRSSTPALSRTAIGTDRPSQRVVYSSRHFDRILKGQKPPNFPPGADKVRAVVTPGPPRRLILPGWRGCRADAVAALLEAGAMRDWGRLVALYPGGDAMPKAKNPREDLMLRSPAPARWAFWRRRTARCGSDEP